MAISILTGARRSGKTTSLVFSSVMKAMSTPNIVGVFIPTNHLQKDYVKDLIVESIKNQHGLRSVENTVVNFSNGSRIHVLSPGATRHIPYLNKVNFVMVDEPKLMGRYSKDVDKIISNLETDDPLMYIMVSELEQDE